MEGLLLEPIIHIERLRRRILRPHCLRGGNHKRLNAVKLKFLKKKKTSLLDALSPRYSMTATKTLVCSVR